MNLKRWLSVILMMGLILAYNPFGAQADPYRPYHHPPGNAYGWDGPRPHGFDNHYKKHFRRSYRGPHNPHYVGRVYGGSPQVAYLAPVAPVIGIPYAQPQPYNSQPAPRGLSGNINFGF
jgi:hypothetical protein